MIPDLYVEVAGAHGADRRGPGREPLVLVHGSWSDHTTWRFVVPALSRERTVVAYDRRGHSRSPWDAPVTRREDEDDLIRIVESLDAGPVHLVGSSYGGSISLAVASRRPGLVAGVVAHEPPLLGVGGPGTDVGRLVAEIGAVLGEVAADIARGDAESAARRFAEDGVLGPGSWQVLPPEHRAVMLANARSFAGMLRSADWDQVPDEPAASVRVLLTDGPASPAWLRGIAAALATRYPRARRATFGAAGHMPHVTHPDEFVRTVHAAVAAGAGVGS